MKVLVTGATGFIGRYLVAALESAGVEYISVGRSPTATGSSHLTVDLCSGEDISATIAESEATHLIHLAWYTKHGLFWESPLNVAWRQATIGLVQRFVAAGGRHVLLTGTCAEYDWRYGYCREDLTPIRPISVYAESKHATHEACAAICARFGVGMAWARVFFPYGRGESEDRLIPSLFAALRGQREPFGVNRRAYRDLLHVTDLARGLLLCSTHELTGAVNLCSGVPVSLEDVVHTVAALVNADPGLILTRPPARVEDTRFLVGDPGRLESIGGHALIKLPDGLSSY